MILFCGSTRLAIVHTGLGHRLNGPVCREDQQMFCFSVQIRVARQDFSSCSQNLRSNAFSDSRKPADRRWGRDYLTPIYSWQSTQTHHLPMQIMIRGSDGFMSWTAERFFSSGTRTMKHEGRLCGYSTVHHLLCAQICRGIRSIIFLPKNPSSMTSYPSKTSNQKTASKFIYSHILLHKRKRKGKKWC